MAPIKNHTNQRKGRLVAVKFFGKDKYFNALWLFRCDCGNEIVRTPYQIFSGKTDSCGCLKKENISKRKKTHGMSNGTRFYKTWGGMLYRSRNKQRWYTDINVCERWEKFEYFMEDLLPSYEEHVKQFGIDDTTIDRINPFGNYEPGNVRWATRKQQANNRRQSRSKDGVKISSSSND